jgi:predicted PurR-regulated permease PerM
VIFAVISKIVSALSPIIWGFIIAYMLNPIMLLLQRRLFSPLGKKLFKNNGFRSSVFDRAASAALVVIVFVVLLAVLSWLVIPQIYLSLESIVVSMPEYIDRAAKWVDRIMENFPTADDFVSGIINRITEVVADWARNDAPQQLKAVLINISAGVINMIRGLFNLLVGIIVSIYLLYSKESFIARMKKLLYSLFSERAVGELLKAARFTDRAFLRYIGGKLLDSLIIGIITYIFCVIAKMPYAVLISVVIGITNIIPFFGPFIGAIPCALLVLTQSGPKCLVFIIFNIILQQLDGNFLAPRILGNRSGMSGFWIMFAILLGGGLFGFTGMILSVPIFTVIYAAIRYWVDKRLEKRGLSRDTTLYVKQTRTPPREEGSEPPQDGQDG